MRRIHFLILWACLAPLVLAEDSAILLPSETTRSPRVANQDPVGAFAMPASALRFEPLLDLQARNFGEAQSDVTIRGGIFENTGFRIGGVSLYDPQTGHYFAEIPVAPAMLSEPTVFTGTGNALDGFNANVGTVAYGWRRVTTHGEATLGAGEYGLERQSVYQGAVLPVKLGGRTLAADAEYSHSHGDGTIPFGDHHFSRANVRLQLADDTAQTDLFLGYQAKFFGWPDLYTPFDVHETENLQTNLLMLNHRQNLGGGDFFEVGAFYRRNKDDYEYSREHPGLYNPYQHVTWARAVAASGRQGLSFCDVEYSAEVLSDELRSTSLVYGRPFSSRTYYKAGVIPEKNWELSDGRRFEVRAGATFDATNRDASALSPQVEFGLTGGDGEGRAYLSYAKTTQVPTYTALKSNPTAGLFRGNRSLGREQSHNIELGWKTKRGAWELQTAVFYRLDRSLVDWTYADASTAARTANPVDIDTVGFEAVGSYTVARLKFVLGYTWLDKSADYRRAAVDASFYAMNFAKHRLTAAITVRLGGGFELRMDNETRIQEDNPLRKVGGDEAVLTSVGVYFRPKAAPGVELSLAADNLWNSNFEEVPGVPAGRREVSGQIGYSW